MAMSNHIDSPYLFKIKDSKLDECMEYTSLNKPMVVRPIIDDEQIDPTESLGTCLGFSLLTTKPRGSPATVEITLTDEEEDFPYPPVLCMYGLDSKLIFYQVLNGRWKDSSLLNES